MENQLHLKSEGYARRMVLSSLIELSKTDPDGFLLLARLFRIALETDSQLAGEKVWAKRELSLREFYDALIECGRLDKDEDWENFRNTLLGCTSTFQQIKWLGNTNELVYVMNRFTDEKVIERHETPYALLKRIFLNRFGKQLNNRSLGVLLEKGVANKENEGLMDKIIARVLRAITQE